MRLDGTCLDTVAWRLREHSARTDLADATEQKKEP